LSITWELRYLVKVGFARKAALARQAADILENEK